MAAQAEGHRDEFPANGWWNAAGSNRWPPPCKRIN